MFSRIIQGGMGIGISGWQLANAVAGAGQMGVVSGICLDEMLARRLQLGDAGGYMRKALEHFPIKKIAKDIADRFFKEDGKKRDKPFLQLPNKTLKMEEREEDLIVAGSFVEVFLAKAGHLGKVGINFLHKAQTEMIPALYGAMLAGVDFVTMGAGIPREVPGILDFLSENKEATLKLNVAGASSTDDFKLSFNPARYGADKLKRPDFYAIVSSNVLALTLSKKSNGSVEGFIIEGPTAGGHNAPPRVSGLFNERGEPLYGEKDRVDIEKIQALEKPFWLAGGYGRRGGLEDALSLGAQGIQAGTPFLLCRESGLRQDIKEAILSMKKRDVYTSAFASPTGFPFKVAQVEGTLSEEAVYRQRPRVCNMGYLRERYRKEDGSVGYRCAAEPVEAFEAKGGDADLARKSKCLCNALFANIGLGSVYRNGYEEQPLITAGDILSSLDYVYDGIPAKEVIGHLAAGEGV